MLHLIGKIPKCPFYVACSGGTDSMVLLDFLSKYPKNKITVLHFNHGTEYCPAGEENVRDYCSDHKIKIIVEKISRKKEKCESWEQYWRTERYAFFSKYKEAPILQAHHLNDCIETWIMTCMQGIPHLIPYYNRMYNIYRPFLTVSKKCINEWITDHKLTCVIDGSNFDTTVPRNMVRHKMMNYVLQLNPGIEKSISRKIKESYQEERKFIPWV